MTKAYFENEKIHLFVADSRHVPSHTHPFLELAYVRRGEALHTVANRQYPIKRGDFFIIDYHTSHAYESTGAEPLEVINCLFLPEFIDPALVLCNTLEKLLRHYLIRMQADSFHPDPAAYCFQDEDGSMLTLLSSMLQEYAEKAAGYTEVLRASLITVLIRSVRRLSFAPATGGTMAEVEKYIHTHFAEPLSMGMLARQHNYSAPYFSQRFKQATGLTFTAYLRRTRMEEACRLLANTDEKIIDVASRVGYRDLDAFLVAFKATQGMSPRAFRKYIKG